MTKRDRIARNKRRPMRRDTRKQILEQFWKSNVKDEFDVTKSIQRQAQFPHANAVMDRIGWNDGNEGGKQIEATIAASMRVYTKAVICDGQRLFRGSHQRCLCNFSRQPRLDLGILVGVARQQNSGGIEL